MSEQSIAERIAMLSPAEQKKTLGGLSREQQEALKYDWNFWGRPKQLIPVQDREWDILWANAGRAWGKSRAGSEWIRNRAESTPACRIALVAPTAKDVRDIMVLGNSGIMACCPEGSVRYERSKSRLVWKNGSIANMLSADEPDRIRGYGFHYAWFDEISSIRYEEAFDMLRMTLREGKRPQMFITSTPKINDITLRLMDMVEKDPKNVRMITGSSYENKYASESFIRQLQEYEGTDLGDQEIHAIIKKEVSGALWKRDWLHIFKKYDIKTGLPNPEPYYGRTVVAVDVATTDNKRSDFTVIVVASEGEVDATGKKPYYIREVLGLKCVPGQWAEKIVSLYMQYKADVIVVETNQGGKMVEEMIYNVKNYKDTETNTHKRVDGHNLPVKGIHAHDGKRLRAEPVSMLYQKGRVIHIGSFSDLEGQMLRFTGQKGGKDDYVDALVYAIKELAGEPSAEYFVPIVSPQEYSSDLKLM